MTMAAREGFESMNLTVPPPGATAVTECGQILHRPGATLFSSPSARHLSSVKEDAVVTDLSSIAATEIRSQFKET